MNKPRNIFSYIMWAISAGLIAVLYYFATLDFLNTIDSLDATYNIVITVLIGIIIVELIILFDNLLKRAEIKGGESKSKVLGILGLVVSIASFFVARVVNAPKVIDIYDSADLVHSSYSKSVIGSNGLIFVDGTSVSRLYDSLTSLFFKFLGNTSEGIYVSNIVIQLITFCFLYFAVKRLYGRIETFVVGLAIALLPIFAVNKAEYGYYYMEVLIFAVGLYIVSLIKPLCQKKLCVLWVALMSLLMGGLLFYSNLILGIIALGIVIILESKETGVLGKVFGSLITFVAVPVGYLVCAIIEPIYYGRFDSMIDEALNKIIDSFQYSINVINIFEYALDNMMLIVFILGIVYVVMFLRRKFDEAHSVIMLLIITVAIMTLTITGPSNNAYDMTATICLLILGGAGAGKLITRDDIDNDLVIDTSIDPEPDPDDKIPVVEIEDLDNEDNSTIEIQDLDKEDSNINSENHSENVVLFKNPLPLPKKAEKRDFDYDYEVSEADMHFDIELTDDNCFYEVV